ncbi:mechanosensitive ion channel [Candidatus Fermentibacteria bacterium]|nr:mechanosensitive ion channel [Candidatus Fermentibacteria bacterium]
MIYHTIEAVALGLAVGLLLWLIRKRAPGRRMKLWVLLSGASGGLYLVLSIMGVDPESTGSKIVLAATILLGSNMLLQFFNYLVWDSLLKSRQGVMVPRLIIDVINFVILAVVAIAVLNSIFDVQLTAFLVTSTVISAVIGLSLQDILGNVFAGLALQIEKPFSINDWVEAGSQTGQIVERNWRTLTIRTRENDLVIIPNATASKEMLINFSRPEPLRMGHARVGVAYDHPPGIVKDVVTKAVMETRGVQKDPCPDVLVQEFADFSIVYDVRYWITDYASMPKIDDAVKCRIWYSLHRAGLRIPFPITDVNLYTVPEDFKTRIRSQLREDLTEELRSVELFEPLSEEQLQQLAARCSKLRYAAGEVLVKQGAKGDSLYLIRSGRVKVELVEDGSITQLATLQPGDYFGEMSLLTGEERSATVTAVEETEVVVVDKEGLSALLEEDSRMLEELSRMLEQRLSEISTQKEALTKKRKHVRTADNREDEDLLGRIRSFFGF